ncbi:MAG: hypothetical protein RIG66_03945 [Coleofasciculus sp. E2-BRE-01]
MTLFDYKHPPALAKTTRLRLNSRKLTGQFPPYFFRVLLAQPFTYELILTRKFCRVNDS